MSIETSPVRRVRPWVRRLAIYLLPLLAAFCGIAAWDYIETRRLTSEIEAIAAMGEPITIGPLVNRAYGKADNAEYKYSAAGLLTLADDGMKDPTSEGRSMAALRRPVDFYSRFTPVRQWLDGAADRPGTTGAEGVLQALSADWRDALSLVDAAIAMPYYGVAPGTEFNYRVAGLWNLTRLLSARTIGLTLTGDADAAAASAISFLRLRRALRPSQRWLPIVGHEVPVVLSLSAPSEHALERLQTTLASEEDPDGPTRDFIEVRARILNDAWLSKYRVAPGTPLPPPFPAELWPSPAMRPWVTHELVNALRAWSELAEIARQPWPARRGLAAEPIARYAKQARRSGYIGVGMVVGIFYQTIRPDVLVHDRSSRVAVAVERFRRGHRDALPASLNDLVPQYLESIPQDPLTGQALRYRVRPDAYVVYSVGPDGQDDGGSQLRQTPASPAGRFPRGADMGIRVLTRRP